MLNSVSLIEMLIWTIYLLLGILGNLKQLKLHVFYDSSVMSFTQVLSHELAAILNWGKSVAQYLVCDGMRWQITSVQFDFGN